MEESVEAATSAEQPNKKLINFLGAMALMLAILMILLVLAALGFLIYGLLAARLVVSIIGVVACVISFGVLFGLFRLINTMLRRRADELAELSPRYQSEQEEKRRKRHESYTRIKDELSTRYGRARIDQD